MKNPIDQHWDDWQKRHQPKREQVEEKPLVKDEVSFIDDLEPVEEENPPDVISDFEVHSSAFTKESKKPKRR